jgi:hypothetical protein
LRLLHFITNGSTFLHLAIGASPASSEFVFSLTPKSFCSGATYLSTDSQRALVLPLNNRAWIIAWEDYSDADFNDLVVRIDLDAQPLPFLSLPFASTQTPGAFPLALVSGFMDHQYPTNQAAPNDHWAYRVSFRGDDSQIERAGTLDVASFDGSDGTGFQLAVSTPTWAAARGTVIFAGSAPISCAPKRMTFNANVVRVRYDNGFVTEYWWLKSIAAGIATGVEVTSDAGALLGNTGTNRCTDKAGLHLVVRNPQGVAVDPFGWRPQPDSPWFGLDDPWQQSNNVLGKEATSYRLWLASDDNVGLVTPNEATTIRSSDARVTVTAPAYAFSQPVRLELADVSRPAGASTSGLQTRAGVEGPISGADLNSLRSFALFGYTVGNEVVTTAQQDIAIDVEIPRAQVPGGMTPVFYLRGSNPFETANWRPLPTSWNASTGHAHMTTRELGTIALAWKTSRVFAPLVRR